MSGSCIQLQLQLLCLALALAHAPSFNFGSQLIHLALDLVYDFCIWLLVPASDFMVVTSASTFQARDSLDPGVNICFPSVVGGSTISYANVATYEANIGGQFGHLGFHDTVCSGVPIAVCNPIKTNLKLAIVASISNYMDNFLAKVAIFHFKGFWPSLSDLHAWISSFWEPIISETAHIYLMPRVFFHCEI